MNILFEILAILIFNLLLFGKLFVFNKKNPVIIGNYVAFITFLLGLYCLVSIYFVFKAPFSCKLFYLFFALSPFLIGKLATYKTLTIYANLQLFIILFSGFYTIYFLY